MNQWIIRKKDVEGNKYDIRIYFLNGELKIDDVGVIKKGKRKPIFIGSELSRDYIWRGFDRDKRRDAKAVKITNEVPENLIIEALEDVWQKLKPVTIEFL